MSEGVQVFCEKDCDHSFVCQASCLRTGGSVLSHVRLRDCDELSVARHRLVGWAPARRGLCSCWRPRCDSHALPTSASSAPKADAEDIRNQPDK